MSVSDFETFWKSYPRKVGKDAALKAWNKKKPNLDEVLKALEWQTQSAQWLKDGGQFIPHPATYLNQGRWKDEPCVIESKPVIRNKSHFMSDDQFNDWLFGDVNGKLSTG